jgi:uncharacterized protein (DUF433 family)
MRKHRELDWLDCPDVETIPGKQDGAPLVKGTRIPVQQLIEEYDLGSSVDEIARNYELPGDQVRRIIAFGAKLKPQLVP